jgi:hypothetical protein
MESTTNSDHPDFDDASEMVAGGFPLAEWTLTDPKSKKSFTNNNKGLPLLETFRL